MFVFTPRRRARRAALCNIEEGQSAADGAFIIDVIVNKSLSSERAHSFRCGRQPSCLRGLPTCHHAFTGAHLGSSTTALALARVPRARRHKVAALLPSDAHGPALPRRATLPAHLWMLLWQATNHNSSCSSHTMLHHTPKAYGSLGHDESSHQKKATVTKSNGLDLLKSRRLLIPTTPRVQRPQPA